ncbi:MAG: NfeD family protein [Gemmatimonadota bacterium]
MEYVTVLDPAGLEVLAQLFASPLIAPILLALGVLGLVFELKAGAFGLGALLSFLAFSVFFGSHFLLGMAGWQEVLLLGLGVFSVALEMFVLPGVGVVGAVGVCFIGAAVMLALLGTRPTGVDFAGALGVLGASLAIVLAVFYAWLRHLPTSQRFAGLLHTSRSDRAGGYIAAPQRDDLVGLAGVAVTDLRPSGTATIGGERVDVVSEGGFIAAGQPVTVIRADGYRQVVRSALPQLHSPVAQADS